MEGLLYELIELDYAKYLVHDEQITCFRLWEVIIRIYQ